MKLILSAGISEAFWLCFLYNFFFFNFLEMKFTIITNFLIAFTSWKNIFLSMTWDF